MSRRVVLMTSILFQSEPRTRRRSPILRVAFLLQLLFALNLICFAQADPALPPSSKSPTDKPLSADERAELLKLIRSLQERVEKLEAAQASTDKATLAPEPSASPATVQSEPPENSTTPVPVAATPPKEQDEGDDKFDGRYTPNLGFKVANAEYGDLNVGIYTYVRYLNQLGLDATFTDAFGITKTVQNRHDLQLLKLQIKFLGWLFNPKFRYFLYAWTSNANQGQGAQVVLAGNLQYTFNKYFTLGGGIRSLPGTRSVEGNFPFWLSVDSRHIADEFMRPSYTSGVWATGSLTDRLKYQVMLGNNLSTLGVPASRLDNGLNTLSSSLVWFPTGDFEKGFSGQGWGDFEHHEKFSTRLGFHFSRSDENRERQPNSEQFENTQLRLSDGTGIFTPDIFGPGVTIEDARYRMVSLDGGFKYRGFSLEGEYFWRWLDKFRGENTGGIPRLFDQSAQIQASAMIVPQSLQAYAGYSKIFGQFGQPWDFRVGPNFVPFKNKGVRWNTEALYLDRSPFGYTSVPFPLGGRGWVFHSNMELAF